MPRGRLPRLDLPERTYYLTSCVEGRRPLLRRGDLAEAVIEFYSQRRRCGEIALHGYVVMPDHYHVLVTLRGSASISGVVRKVHSLFARLCRRTTGLRGPIWQSRFYDHVIRDEDDWRAKLSYMHGNPVRAELVQNATEYPWSSCRFWEAGEGPVRCDGLE